MPFPLYILLSYETMIRPPYAHCVHFSGEKLLLEKKNTFLAKIVRRLPLFLFNGSKEITQLEIEIMQLTQTHMLLFIQHKQRHYEKRNRDETATSFTGL